MFQETKIKPTVSEISPHFEKHSFVYESCQAEALFPPPPPPLLTAQWLGLQTEYVIMLEPDIRQQGSRGKLWQVVSHFCPALGHMFRRSNVMFPKLITL